jgi:DNA processing protein
MCNIILLSLVQKNFRLIQNRSLLTSLLVDHAVSADKIVSHLEEHETLFTKTVLGCKNTMATEKNEISRLREQGVQFCFPGDVLYPESFIGMPGAPFLFSFLGHPCWMMKKSLAVVGSREASTLSRRWMEDCFTNFLLQAQPVIVSGGARGIDQMAHQLALRNSCPTVVVLPSGLNTMYPPSLEAWKSKVIEGGGCFLSEYPYYQEMLKHFFQDRNRLIAALGAMTLLVEAKRRSGSLLTAQKTLELGKSVFVVPGHPSDISHLGNIDLLTEGATPVRDAEDLHTYFLSELRGVSLAMPRSSQHSLPGC